MSTPEAFDYVVVGGGSAGCIAAARLAENPEHRVLLLEAGPPAEAHPETLSADGYKHAFINDEVIWERFTAPQAHAGRERWIARSRPDPWPARGGPDGTTARSTEPFGANDTMKVSPTWYAGAARCSEPAAWPR